LLIADNDEGNHDDTIKQEQQTQQKITTITTRRMTRRMKRRRMRMRMRMIVVMVMMMMMMAWHEHPRGFKRIQEDSAGARTSHHRAYGIGRQK
jgi:hypothetical protein